MPENDFLPFGIGARANVLPAIEWKADSERIMGFEKGIAKSIKANTAWRHCSFVTAAVAALMAETLNEDVLDNGELPDFINQLRRTIIEATGGPDAPIDGEWYVRYNRTWVNGSDIFLRLTGGTMVGPGWLTLHAPPVMAMHAVNRGYVDDIRDNLLNLLRSSYVPLAGTDGCDPPRMRGFITLHAFPQLPMHAANKGYVDQEVGTLRDELENNYLPLIGGTMLGYITLHADPADPMQAANKQYVDNELERQLRGYLPLTGGTLYRTGGNDILTIEADTDRFARIRYSIRDRRVWSAGADNLGHFAIADESAGRYRFRIDTNGVKHAWHEGGPGLLLEAPGDRDCYLQLIGQGNWQIGPQANAGRFLFYNNNDRFAIYDDGSISCANDAHVGHNVYVTWDAVVGASVVIGTNLGVSHWLQNLDGSLYSASRFVAFDFQSTNNCLVDGWIFANGDGGITSQRGWISCWGAGIQTNNCLKGGHLEIDNWTRLQEGCHIPGLFPGHTDGLICEQRARFHNGLWVPNGIVTVDNAFIARTSGGAEVHNGLVVVSGDTWMNCWNVTIGPGNAYGYGDLWVNHSIRNAYAPLMCGFITSPWFYAVEGIQSNGWINAAADINANGNIVSANGVYGSYLRTYGGLDVDGWIAGTGGRALEVTAALTRFHQHVNLLNGACFWGFGAVVNATLQATENNDVFVSRNLVVYGVIIQSDERFKTHITPVVPDALQAVRRVRFYEYDHQYEGGGETHETTGLTAQQIEEAMPEAVSVSTLSATVDLDEYRTGRGCGSVPVAPYKTIRLMPLLSYSMRAIQQLADRNDALEARIAELEGRI